MDWQAWLVNKNNSMKTEIKYQFAAMPGGVLNNTTAVVVGESLNAIEARDGAIKPAAVVAEARPKASPLHSLFTWDNSKAAELYRLDEARNIIRSVRIIRMDIPAAEQHCIRAKVHVQAHDKEDEFEGPGYIGFARAIDDQRYLDQILTAARTEMNSWARKYADIVESAGIQEDVEAITTKLAVVKK